jgi:hypothetical protein
MGHPVSRRSERENTAHRFADAGWHVFPAEPGGNGRPHCTASLMAPPTTRNPAVVEDRSEVQRSCRDRAPGPDVVDVDKHKEGNGFGAYNRLKQAMYDAQEELARREAIAEYEMEAGS